MSNPGPWSQLPPPPPPARPPPPRRPVGLAWLGLAAAIGLAVFGLSRLFPGQVSSSSDWAAAAGGVAMAALVGARLLTRGLEVGKAVRHLAIWGGVVAVLLLAYSFKDELGPVAARLRSAIVPGYPVVTMPGEQMISRDQSGGFFVVGSVNGKPVRFLVDTGSSDIVLSPADAQRLGVDPATLRFDHPVETANGEGFGAPFTADSLTVGGIALDHVPMSINKAPMSSSLLGMAFFNRLKSFRFEGDRLYLRPRT
jgi:aspartyl protease family protein